MTRQPSSLKQRAIFAGSIDSLAASRILDLLLFLSSSVVANCSAWAAELLLALHLRLRGLGLVSLRCGELDGQSVRHTAQLEEHRLGVVMDEQMLLAQYPLEKPLDTPA